MIRIALAALAAVLTVALLLARPELHAPGEPVLATVFLQR